MDGVERLRGGGPAAAVSDPRLFEEFYRRHVDAVMRFVARRVDDPHTAADLTAEIFLAVLDSADSYRPRLGSETAWLYGIARDVVSSERRRIARETERDLRISGRRFLNADDIVRIEDRLDAERPARRMLAALAGLPEGERVVIELIAVDASRYPRGLRAESPALSLGSDGARAATWTCVDSLCQPRCAGLIALLSTVAARAHRHAVGTVSQDGGHGARAADRDRVLGRPVPLVRSCPLRGRTTAGRRPGRLRPRASSGDPAQRLGGVPSSFRARMPSRMTSRAPSMRSRRSNGAGSTRIQRRIVEK